MAPRRGWPMKRSVVDLLADFKPNTVRNVRPGNPKRPDPQLVVWHTTNGDAAIIYNRGAGTLCFSHRYAKGFTQEVQVPTTRRMFSMARTVSEFMAALVTQCNDGFSSVSVKPVSIAPDQPTYRIDFYGKWSLYIPK